MLITSIKIRKFENTQTKLLGVAEIVLDDMIVIHDIKILQNNAGLFLAMPSKALKNNTFRDIVHPINKDVRSVFERLIFDMYKMIDEGMYIQASMVLDNDNVKSLYDEYIEDFIYTDPTMYF